MNMSSLDSEPSFLLLLMLPSTLLKKTSFPYHFSRKKPAIPVRGA